MAQLTEREVRTVKRGASPVLTLLKWFVALSVLAGIAAATYLIWEHYSAIESTDDAQIDGTIVPVSSRIAGNVASVQVGDEQPVKAGQVLVQLDQRDYQVAVARAQANLADAQAGLQGARNAVPVASISSSSALSGARSS